MPIKDSNTNTEKAKTANGRGNGAKRAAGRQDELLPFVSKIVTKPMRGTQAQRASTQVTKSNKKAHCGIKRRNITKQKAIKRRKRRKAKRNCQNTNRKLTRREEKNMNGKSCRTCGTVKVKAKVRASPQEQQQQHQPEHFQEPFRLFTDFGSNEFNL